ncbi:holo-ACP synthase [Thalassotalea eurytherma]|uniref:Holo-[acyl-carrier-protein] synthase n=1 Tax=Thalassotalea eurytherma TaxID=1144278 RepID=A0ABQ6H1J2_9GAMM|nr:holo-ACP synthase [Thalassotalea eurytherma]GLX81409.1 holo-[acyl-carrier-protein] synthase [Thalassotalea eurytherma]
MSVVGIGTDIIDSERIASMTLPVRDKLALRVLTPTELSIYHSHAQPSQFLAKRWAAKEAASKALATGIAKGVSFQHFEISNTEAGAPVISLSDVALQKAKELGANHWHVSIADEKHIVTAFVVLSH